MFKVCFVDYTRSLCGVRQAFVEVICQAGFEVDVILMAPSERRNFLKSIKIHNVRLHHKPHSKKAMLQFVKECVKIFNQEQYDIIHIFSSTHLFGLVKMMILARTKIIYHLLSYPLGNSKYRILKSKFLIFLQCLLMDRVLIQSAELKNHMIGLKYMKKVSVVPIGFREEDYKDLEYSDKVKIRTQLGISTNAPLIVYCGVLDKLRRLENMILSFSYVLKEIPQSIFLIIGDGNNRAALEAQATKLGIRNHIIFTGYLPHRPMCQLLRVSDVGVAYIPVTEIYTYNPPQKLFDYLGAGLPTVATKTVSNKEIIRDGWNGLLVKDDPQELAYAISRLLKDNLLRKRIAKVAKKSIESFSYKKIVADKLIPIYENLLQTIRA